MPKVEVPITIHVHKVIIDKIESFHIKAIISRGSNKKATSVKLTEVIEEEMGVKYDAAEALVTKSHFNTANDKTFVKKDAKIEIHIGENAKKLAKKVEFNLDIASYLNRKTGSSSSLNFVAHDSEEKLGITMHFSITYGKGDGTPL